MILLQILSIFAVFILVRAFIVDAYIFLMCLHDVKSDKRIRKIHLLAGACIYGVLCSLLAGSLLHGSLTFDATLAIILTSLELMFLGTIGSRKINRINEVLERMTDDEINSLIRNI